MPAVTLGFAEIEERLQTLRRRLNLFDAQHVAYLALSVLALAAAAVIVAALRGSPRLFSLTSLIVLILAVVTPIVSTVVVWRRWRDLRQVASLVDERARLQDRIVTLLHARERQPPPRLAGLLLADAFAMRSRWTPRVVAPRRMPRSVYALLAALAALGSTVFIERQPPPVAPTRAGDATVVAAPQPAGVRLTAQPLQTSQAVKEPAAHHAESAAGTVPLGAPGSAGGDEAAEGAVPATDNSQSHGASRSDRLARDLQQLIRHAFNAAATDDPQQLARQQPGRGSDGDRSDHSSSERDQPHGSADPRPAPGAAPKADAAAANAPDQHGSGARPQPNTRQSADEPSNRSGQPGAGSGSSSRDLLAAPGAPAAPGTAEPKTFKVTLTSFLQGVAVRPAPQPPARRGRVSDEGFAAPSHSSITISEQQVGDDALRKTDIPPEFEEIVRRVFSQRPAS